MTNLGIRNGRVWAPDPPVPLEWVGPQGQWDLDRHASVHGDDGERLTYFGVAAVCNERGWWVYEEEEC